MIPSFKDKLKRIEGDIYTLSNECISVNDVYLSIQASKHHYCTPTVDYNDPKLYKEYEMAIVSENAGYVTPECLSLLNIPNNFIEKINEHFDGAGIYPRIPSEVIQQLYLMLLITNETEDEKILALLQDESSIELAYLLTFKINNNNNGN